MNRRNILDKSAKTHAITLVEMIAVIALIMMCFLLLIHVNRSARRSTMMQACRADFKKIDLAYEIQKARKPGSLPSIDGNATNRANNAALRTFLCTGKHAPLKRRVIYDDDDDTTWNPSHVDGDNTSGESYQSRVNKYLMDPWGIPYQVWMEGSRLRLRSHGPDGYQIGSMRDSNYISDNE